MGFNSNHILDLLHHPIRIRAGKINLINHREYIQIMIQGHIHIRQGLGLDPLGSIHYQHGSIAGSQRPGYLIVKIHMAWGVNQVKNILLAAFGRIHGAHRLSLDGNAPLPLNIHIVQYLILHLP